VKSRATIIRVTHVRQFPSCKTESSNRMATLQNYETLLGSIANFFHFRGKIEKWVKLFLGGG
jgi:hypothetical protein